MIGGASLLGRGLSAAGRQGPTLLVVSLLLGSALPSLATGAYTILPASAFLLTLGSFLAAGLSMPEKRLHTGLIVASLLWVAVLLPAATTLITRFSGASPALQTGIILSFVAPPVGSAAAIASMLGLKPRLALVTSLALTVVAPASMPISVALAGVGVTLNVLFLMARLLVIVGAAALVALILLRWKARLRAFLPDAQAGSGVAVIGLIIVGLAMTTGVRRFWATDAHAFIGYLCLAATLNLTVCLVSALAFSQTGIRNAATVGLVSGNRNVTLIWAAVGSGLPIETEAYVAACVAPILSLPLVIKIGAACLRSVRRLRHRKRVAATSGAG